MKAAIVYMSPFEAIYANKAAKRFVFKNYR